MISYKFISHTATINRRDVSKIQIRSRHSTARNPVLAPGGLRVIGRWLFSLPASYVFHLCVLQPRWAPCACMCVVFSLSSGWLHPVCRTLVTSTWLILIGHVWETMPSQLHHKPLRLWHHSAQCSVLFLSFSLNCTIHTLSSSLCLPAQCLAHGRSSVTVAWRICHVFISCENAER